MSVANKQGKNSGKREQRAAEIITLFSSSKAKKIHVNCQKICSRITYFKISYVTQIVLLELSLTGH